MGLLLVATFLAYLPVLRASYIWDDDDYVLNNPTLRSIGGLAQIWFQPSSLPQYYPLVHTTYWIEYHLWELWWPGYHFVNVALHAASVVVLWLLLRRLKVPGAFLAALIFAVHPVEVESVAWITERKNVLSLLFYLLAMSVYLRLAGLDGEGHIPRPPVDSGGRPKVDWRLYGWALGLFLLALFSKTVTSTLPAAILLVLWWRRGKLHKEDFLLLLPFFIVGLGLAAYTGFLEQHLVGAVGAEWDLSPSQRVLIAGQAFWFYIGKLLWPAHLTFIYPRWSMATDQLFTIDPRGWQWIFPAAAGGLILALFVLRRWIGRGPVVGVLFFAGTLLPALGFINVYPMRYSFVADHFQYHASIGLIALIAAAIVLLVRRLAACTSFEIRVQDSQTLTPSLSRSTGRGGNNAGSRFNIACGAVAAVVAVPLAILTFLQCGIYQDRETLWRDTLAKNSDSWMVHTNLAHALVDQGRVAEALAEYRKSLDLAPELPETNWNWGVGLAKQEKFDEAIEYYDRAIACNPRYGPAYYSKGNALMKQDKEEEAIACYRKALELQPDYAAAWYEFGKAMDRQQKIKEAIGAYQQAVNFSPYDADAHYNLANDLLNQRQLAGAVKHYQQVLQLNPRHAEAHANLGSSLLLQGQIDKAIGEYQAALSINPNLVPAQRGLEQAMQVRQRR